MALRYTERSGASGTLRGGQAYLDRPYQDPAAQSFQQQSPYGMPPDVMFSQGKIVAPGAGASGGVAEAQARQRAIREEMLQLQRDQQQARLVSLQQKNTRDQLLGEARLSAFSAGEGRKESGFASQEGRNEELFGYQTQKLESAQQFDDIRREEVMSGLVEKQKDADKLRDINIGGATAGVEADATKLKAWQAYEEQRLGNLTATGEHAADKAGDDAEMRGLRRDIYNIEHDPVEAELKAQAEHLENENKFNAATINAEKLGNTDIQGKIRYLDELEREANIATADAKKAAADLKRARVRLDSDPDKMAAIDEAELAVAKTKKRVAEVKLFEADAERQTQKDPNYKNIQKGRNAYKQQQDKKKASRNKWKLIQKNAREDISREQTRLDKANEKYRKADQTLKAKAVSAGVSIAQLEAMIKRDPKSVKTSTREAYAEYVYQRDAISPIRIKMESLQKKITRADNTLYGLDQDD